MLVIREMSSSFACSYKYSLSNQVSQGQSAMGPYCNAWSGMALLTSWMHLENGRTIICTIITSVHKAKALMFWNFPNFKWMPLKAVATGWKPIIVGNIWRISRMVEWQDGGSLVWFLCPRYSRRVVYNCSASHCDICCCIQSWSSASAGSRHPIVMQCAHGFDFPSKTLKIQISFILETDSLSKYSYSTSYKLLIGMGTKHDYYENNLQKK